MGVKTAFSHGAMQLNSLIPAACLLVSACQSLGPQGLREQKTREGKKQVGLPCKTIVEEECEWYNEECKTEYVKHCENNRREKRGVLQAILLASAIASQNPETTEAPARVRCYHSPTTTCRHNYDGSIDGECSTTYHRYCYRARSRRSATESEDCVQVPSKRCSLIPGAQEGAGVKVCRQVNLPKLEKVCAKVETLVC